MDTPINSILSLTNQNIEIKSEIVDIVEIDEQIFTNGGYFGDDLPGLKNASCSANFNVNDDQLIIKQEIICKEEPEFYDTQTSQTFSR